MTSAGNILAGCRQIKSKTLLFYYVKHDIEPRINYQKDEKLKKVGEAYFIFMYNFIFNIHWLIKISHDNS